MSQGRGRASPGSRQASPVRLSWKQTSFSVHIISFSCSRKEKMPPYLLRQPSVTTTLRGQSTCGHSRLSAPPRGAPGPPPQGPC